MELRCPPAGETCEMARGLCCLGNEGKRLKKKKKKLSCYFLAFSFILEYRQLNYRVAFGTQQRDSSTLLSIHSLPGSPPIGEGQRLGIRWLSPGPAWRWEGAQVTESESDSHHVSYSRSLGLGFQETSPLSTPNKTHFHPEPQFSC